MASFDLPGSIDLALGFAAMLYLIAPVVLRRWRRGGRAVPLKAASAGGRRLGPRHWLWRGTRR